MQLDRLILYLLLEKFGILFFLYFYFIFLVIHTLLIFLNVLIHNGVEILKS